MDQLWMAREKTESKNAVRKAFAGADDRPARRRTKFNKLLTDEAAKIAFVRRILDFASGCFLPEKVACSQNANAHPDGQKNLD